MSKKVFGGERSRYELFGLGKLKGMGFQVRNHMNSLSDEDLEKFNELSKPAEDKKVTKKKATKKVAKKKTTKKVAKKSTSSDKVTTVKKASSEGDEVDASAKKKTTVRKKMTAIRKKPRHLLKL